MEKKINVDEHIELRAASPDIAEEKYHSAMNSHDHLLPWLSWAHYYEHDGGPVMLKFQENKAREFDEGISFVYDIFYDKEFTGSIELMHFSEENKTCEIGYWLDKDMTGKGVMTTVVDTITALAFGELGRHRVEIRAAHDNLASRAVAERCNYTLEAELRDAIILEGEFHNQVIYAKIAENQ